MQHLSHGHQSNKRLVASTLALGDDAGHLVNLSLATAEGTEPLLSELARALVLGVAEEFDDATLVGGEAVDARLVESWWWRGFPTGSRPGGGGGKKAYPETSLTMSLTKAVRLLRWPLVRETRGFDWRGVTFCIHASLVSLCPCSPYPRPSRFSLILLHSWAAVDFGVDVRDPC